MNVLICLETPAWDEIARTRDDSGKNLVNNLTDKNVLNSSCAIN